MRHKNLPTFHVCVGADGKSVPHMFQHDHDGRECISKLIAVCPTCKEFKEQDERRS